MSYKQKHGENKGKQKTRPKKPGVHPPVFVANFYLVFKSTHRKIAHNNEKIRKINCRNFVTIEQILKTQNSTILTLECTHKKRKSRDRSLDKVDILIKGTFWKKKQNKR